ncbi:MAG TPA: TldD/PmbA family protein [Chloroflexota bacterium]|nr:TldD/PmbA family protein [Chloroflexota bacterium]
MKELASRALDLARVLGASYADIRILMQKTEVITVKNGTVEGVSKDDDEGFGVRVLANGAWGFASSYRLEPGEIDRVTALAVRVARASALAKRAEVRLGPAVVSRGSYSTTVRIDPFAISMEDKIALLLRADAAMRSVKGVSLAESSLEFLAIEKLFASSEGSLVEQHLVESGGGIEATAVADGEVQKRSHPNSFGRQQGTAGFEFILDMKLEENAPRIAEEAVRLLTAEQCPSDLVTTLILDPTQLALQVHESCGHPIELDRVMGMESSYAGTSFLTLDKMGGFRYGSDIVNIVADATVLGGLGTFGYDDEGVPAQRVPIVQNGIFLNYLTSRETAADLGQQSNGTMRADGWNRIPLIRMTNINLEPGPWSFEELIADTDDGIYMQTNKSWSIDDRRLNFQFGTEVAWEIRGGKRGRMFKNATYTGITPEFWGGCDAICREWNVWGTPNCGKGEPPQVAHVGHGAAAARFRNVRVGVMR